MTGAQRRPRVFPLPVLLHARVVDRRDDSGGVSYSLQSKAYSLRAGEARAGREQRGLGILLAIVVTVCIVLFVAGIAHLFFSSQVFSQAAHGAGGMAAEYIAETALEDILHQLQLDLNDPNSRIFDKVRRALLLREPPELDLTQDCPPRRLAGLLDQSENGAFYRMFTLERTSVKLLTAPVPDRRYTQSLRLEAGVRLSMGRRTEYRQVEHLRLVGITLVAPRRPLDQVPFAIVGTPFIADFREYLGFLDAAIVAYNRTRELLDNWKNQVESKPPNTPMQAVLPPLSLGPETSSNATAVQLYPDQTYQFGAGWRSLTESNLSPLLPADDSVIFAKPAETVALEDFHYYERLQRNLTPLRTRLRGVIDRFPSVMQPLESAAASGWLDSSSHSAWAAGITAMGDELAEIFESMRTEAVELTTHLKDHTAPGITTERVDVPRHFESQVPVMPLSYHMPSSQHALDLIGKWPSISGHMAIYDEAGAASSAPAGETSVTLDGFKGQLILSRESGGFAVGPVTMNSPGRDRLVVHGDSIRIAGSPIQAALVARERLETGSGANVEGCVILLRYPRPPESETLERWSGQVSYDAIWNSGSWRGPTDLSGVKLEHYVVSLDPRLSGREVKWKP
jgi:hypothetical protein